MKMIHPWDADSMGLGLFQGPAFFWTNVPKNSYASDSKNTLKNISVNCQWILCLNWKEVSFIVYHQMILITLYKALKSDDYYRGVLPWERREIPDLLSGFFFLNSPFPAILPFPPSTRTLEKLWRSFYSWWECVLLIFVQKKGCDPPLLNDYHFVS